MNGFIFLVVSSLFIVSNCDTFYPCYWITSARIDCESFSSDVTCGTDGVTYKNKCYFSQAHCKAQSLNLQSYGPCNTQTTSRPTLSPQQGAAVVQDVFCVYLSHTGCEKTLDPTCGSDGRTYTNYCEFEKAKCTHRDLHVRNYGNCTN